MTREVDADTVPVGYDIVIGTSYAGHPVDPDMAQIVLMPEGQIMVAGSLFKLVDAAAALGAVHYFATLRRGKGCYGVILMLPDHPGSPRAWMLFDTLGSERVMVLDFLPMSALSETRVARLTSAEHWCQMLMDWIAGDEAEHWNEWGVETRISAMWQYMESVGVPAILQSHNDVTVATGGDDAFLPMRIGKSVVFADGSTLALTADGPTVPLPSLVYQELRPNPKTGEMEEVTLISLEGVSGMA